MTGSKNISLYLFDRIIIIYSLLMVLVILAVGRPLNNYYDEIVFYIGMAALVLLITRYIDEHRGGVARFIRLLYPIFMFTFFYKITGGLMTLLFDNFFDWQLTGFEKAVFGVNPTLYIDQHLLNPILTEIFSFCYFGYYFMIPVFFLLVYIRKDYEIIKNALSAVCLMFFLSYLLFFLYPIEGPRWHFSTVYVNKVTGPVFRYLVELVIKNGAVHGGCMPSSHFGVALVLTLYSIRYYRRWSWIITVITIGLAIGTVWGRFHYISDVVVGGIIGLGATLFAWKYAERPYHHGQSINKKPETKQYHVS